jgi:hypothetical protein
MQSSPVTLYAKVWHFMHCGRGVVSESSGKVVSSLHLVKMRRAECQIRCRPCSPRQSDSRYGTLGKARYRKHSGECAADTITWKMKAIVKFQA